MPDELGRDGCFGKRAILRECRKEVYDLTNCPIDEVIALQRKHGSICGSIKVVVAAVSLSAAACQNSNSGEYGGKLKVDKEGGEPAYQAMAGMICVPQDSK